MHVRWIAALGFVLIFPAATWAQTPMQEVDVLVYGGTPAGIAAALAAASDGRGVLLVEPTKRIGGLTTCGLSHPDFRTFEALNGTYRELTRRVERYYRQTYGDDSPQVTDCLHGTHAEPGVNLLVFEQMLAEQSRIRVLREYRLVAGNTIEANSFPAVKSVTLADPSGKRSEMAARMFIDASYEGDLLAAAGAKFRVGREARGEYDESLAPDDADGQLQAYNFRLCATRRAENRARVAAPAGYRRDDYLGVLPLLANGSIKSVFGYPSACLYKAQIPRLPNDKVDINDVSRGLVRLSLPGENLAWPEGDASTRQRIFDEHLRWNVGLLYFLQTDEAVPEKFAAEARQWGWCADEFSDSDHLPPQLYVREARRMRGMTVFTEHDTDPAPDDARSVLHRDAIAMGDYGPNCHGTAHEGSRFGGRHTGEFYKAVAPYQVPYGVIVPSDVTNLLVPVACSASHVGFCALRLEPIWTSLGQAAGHAAGLAIEAGNRVAEVPVAALQRRLHATGSATIYFSDLLPGDDDFAAAQWWGTAGGFHGLAATPKKPGQRGKNIVGQYYEAFPDHAAQLEMVLDAALAARWQKLAAELQLSHDKLPAIDGRLTRGQWLRAAWKLRGT
ncbi:MAG TPA: FAD-dependent oxidoreductase [Pirellulales bacterium]|nr:FAD-dependent oxidoreductase [Pirellulales bacterium]